MNPSNNSKFKVSAYDLNLYEHLEYLLKHHPNKDMSHDKLAKLAPWNDDVPQNEAKKNEQKSIHET